MQCEASHSFSIGSDSLPPNMEMTMTPAPAPTPRPDFPTIRFSLFDRMARASSPVVLDAELISGVWRVTKAAAERRARA